MPNTDTSEYTIATNVILANTIPATNNAGFTQYIPNKYKSPNATIKACVIPIVRNNNIFPKYTSIGLYSPCA